MTLNALRLCYTSVLSARFCHACFQEELLSEAQGEGVVSPFVRGVESQSEHLRDAFASGKLDDLVCLW